MEEQGETRRQVTVEEKMEKAGERGEKERGCAPRVECDERETGVEAAC